MFESNAVKAKVEDDRQKQWEVLLPCKDCQVSQICRYKNVPKRIDYPADIFSIEVSCKIRDNYKEVSSK